MLSDKDRRDDRREVERMIEEKITPQAERMFLIDEETRQRTERIEGRLDDIEEDIHHIQTTQDGHTQLLREVLDELD